MLAGELPPKQLRMVQVWVDLHREELLADWELAKQTVTTPEGEVVTMLPGEYKRFRNAADSYLYPNQSYSFVVPEKVAEKMTQAVNAFNAALIDAADEKRKRDAILSFALVEFFNIHPFADANGWVAYILADLLAINEGLPAFFFTSIKEKDYQAFVCALELARQEGDLMPLYEVIERYHPETLAKLGTPSPTKNPNLRDVGV